MYKRVHTTPKHCLAVLLLLLSGTCTRAMAESYVVIGNANNKVTEAKARQQIKRLYLKQQKQWTNGLSATVFDRGRETPEDKTFKDTVLNMSADELAGHWLSVKQRTGETPPRTITSTRTLLKLISRYEGSFGVVNQKHINPLPDGLRVLWQLND